MSVFLTSQHMYIELPRIFLAEQWPKLRRKACRLPEDLRPSTSSSSPHPLLTTTNLTSYSHRLPLLRIPETLSTDVLGKMKVPPKPKYPIFQVADLAKHDAFIFGIPTRYGNFPAQWKVHSSRALVFLPPLKFQVMPCRPSSTVLFHSDPQHCVPFFLLTYLLSHPDLLGPNRRALGLWRAHREIRSRLRLDRYPRGRAGIDRTQCALDARAPWDRVRASWIRGGVPDSVECRGG